MNHIAASGNAGPGAKGHWRSAIQAPAHVYFLALNLIFAPALIETTLVSWGLRSEGYWIYFLIPFIFPAVFIVPAVAVVLLFLYPVMRDRRLLVLSVLSVFVGLSWMYFDGHYSSRTAAWFPLGYLVPWFVYLILSVRWFARWLRAVRQGPSAN